MVWRGDNVGAGAGRVRRNSSYSADLAVLSWRRDRGFVVPARQTSSMSSSSLSSRERRRSSRDERLRERGMLATVVNGRVGSCGCLANSALRCDGATAALGQQMSQRPVDRTRAVHRAPRRAACKAAQACLVRFCGCRATV